MKAEKQHKELQATLIQPKQERSKLSFVDNKLRTVNQTKLISIIQKKGNRTRSFRNLKVCIDNHDIIQCITHGQIIYLGNHPISRQKLNRCTADGLLELLSRYIDSNPKYLDDRQSLRTNIEDMRLQLHVPEPVGWRRVISQVDNVVHPRIRVGLDGLREYEYGAANRVPHIHCYPGGAHVKILFGRKIRRLDLVKNGFLVTNIDYVLDQVGRVGDGILAAVRRVCEMD